MPKSTINFDTVRSIGLTLPGVEESTAYGSPALKLHGKLLACIAVNRSAEPGSLMLCVDFDDRTELLAADPDVYYVTDHLSFAKKPSDRSPSDISILAMEQILLRGIKRSTRGT